MVIGGFGYVFSWEFWSIDECFVWCDFQVVGIVDYGQVFDFGCFQGWQQVVCIEGSKVVIGDDYVCVFDGGGQGSCVFDVS